ncbi:MAG: DUF2141 domain-containing protein [Cyclobacteriaceae bacterium]
MISHYIITLWIGFGALQTNEHAVSITFNNLPSNKGKIALAVYRPSDEFLSDNPYRSKLIPVDSEQPVLNTTLPSGVYAISLYHDENNNDQLDKSMVGLPKEGYGFSNDAMGLFGPPSFEKASFKVTNDTSFVITIQN